MKRIKKYLTIGLTVIALLLAANAAVPPVIGGVTAQAATVKLNKKSLKLVAGKTATLKVSGTKKKVTWKSSKPSVASVNSKGKVTAKKKGTATITAKVSKKTYKCKVTVVYDTKAALKCLGNYIEKKGKKDASGNKYISQTAGQSGKVTIVYLKSAKKFQVKLAMDSLSLSLKLNSNNKTTSAKIDSQIASIKGSATIKPASYKEGGKLSFKAQNLSGISEEEYNATNNLAVNVLFTGMENLVKKAGVTMKDLGFTKY